MPQIEPSLDLAHLPAFSKLASSAADAGCNVFNEPELMEWLGTISQAKLGLPLPKKGSRGSLSGAGRQAKAAAWLATVARKALIRNGTKAPWEPSASEIEAAPAWAREARFSGLGLAKLSLTAQERGSIESVLDWMAAPTGPSTSVDWSKISLDQAVAAERAWVEALSKVEEKGRDEALAAAGEAFVCEVAPFDLDPSKAKTPWRWVELLSKEAMAREGSRMRNCIGKHYVEAKPGESEFFSLRGMDGEPILSVHLERESFSEAKEFANDVPLAGRVGALAKLVQALDPRLSAQGCPVWFGNDCKNLGFRSGRDGLSHGLVDDPERLSKWRDWARAHPRSAMLRDDLDDFLARGRETEAALALELLDWVADGGRVVKDLMVADQRRTESTPSSPADGLAGLLGGGSAARMVASHAAARMDPVDLAYAVWQGRPTPNSRLGSGDATQDRLDSMMACAIAIDPSLDPASLGQRVVSMAAMDGWDDALLGKAVERARAAAGPAPWAPVDPEGLVRRAAKSQSRSAELVKAAWEWLPAGPDRSALAIEAAFVKDDGFVLRMLESCDVDAKAPELIKALCSHHRTPFLRAPVQAAGKLAEACSRAGLQEVLGDALSMLSDTSPLLEAVTGHCAQATLDRVFMWRLSSGNSYRLAGYAPLASPGALVEGFLECAAALQKDGDMAAGAMEALWPLLDRSLLDLHAPQGALVVEAARHGGHGYVSWALERGAPGVDWDAAYAASIGARRVQAGCALALLRSGRVKAPSAESFEAAKWGDMDEAQWSSRGLHAELAEELLSRQSGARLTQAAARAACALDAPGFFERALAELPWALSLQEMTRIVFDGQSSAVHPAFVRAALARAPFGEILLAVELSEEGDEGSARAYLCRALAECMADAVPAADREALDSLLRPLVSQGSAMAKSYARGVGVSKAVDAALAGGASARVMASLAEIAAAEGSVADLAKMDVEAIGRALSFAAAGRAGEAAPLIQELSSRGEEAKPWFDEALGAAALSYSPDADQAIRALLAYADPLAFCHNGLTPLMRAAIRGNSKAVEALIPVSDVDAEAGKGFHQWSTASDLAQEERHPSIVEMLDKASAAKKAELVQHPAGDLNGLAGKLADRRHAGALGADVQAKAKAAAVQA